MRDRVSARPGLLTTTWIGVDLSPAPSHSGSRRPRALPRQAPIGPPWRPTLRYCNSPPLAPQVSVAGLSLLLSLSAFHREPQPQVPGACRSSPASADGGRGRCAVLSNCGRSGSLGGGWGMADAAPTGETRPSRANCPWPWGSGRFGIKTRNSLGLRAWVRRWRPKRRASGIKDPGLAPDLTPSQTPGLR